MIEGGREGVKRGKGGREQRSKAARQQGKVHQRNQEIKVRWLGLEVGREKGMRLRSRGGGQ